MNQNRLLFIQIHTLPPSMHQKLIGHGRCCMQNNQLSTKSPIELKDNSVVVKMFLIRVIL